MGLLSQVGGWLLINFALGHVSASTAVVVLLTQPVITGLLAIPLLGEGLTARQVLGGALELAGIYLCLRRANGRIGEDGRPSSNGETDMDIRGRIATFLAAHTTLTLATVGADGLPAAAAVFYAHDAALNLYFLTEERTQHGRNMLANPVVAGTIQADGQDWRRSGACNCAGRLLPSGHRRSGACGRHLWPEISPSWPRRWPGQAASGF